MIGKTWREAWEHVIPFLAFPPDVRRVVYTTNAIEALNRQIRKAIKTRGHFPNEEAARKLIYLAIINAVPSWTKPTTGRQPCSRSRSTSETDCPTKPLTQKIGRPPRPTRFRFGCAGKPEVAGEGLAPPPSIRSGHCPRAVGNVGV